MNLSQLSAVPTLIQISLDDEAIIAQYGEAITFWTYDRQPMSTFMALAKAEAAGFENMFGIIKDLILDERAVPILTNETMLPTAVLMKAIGKVVEMLGK
jgi:hypothetical protein